MQNNYDVIIIGGSYAGLSAAIALGRSLKKVLVIDGGKPCNRQTPYSHNFITHDGVKPRVIAQKAHDDVKKYTTVDFVTAFAKKGIKNENDFTIITDDDKIFHARKLIFATGIIDEMPDIKGFSDCWGITAVHCPYCHGYELKGKRTGIIANGDRANHLATLINNLTDDITIFTEGKATFTTEQMDKFQKHNIKIVGTKILELEHQDGHLKHVILKNGIILPFDGVYGSLPFAQHSIIPMELGCEVTEQGHIKVDAFQNTTVAGVFACGDNSSMMRSVASAVYTGNMAGAGANATLCAEAF